jgi:hypothetical protein
MEVPVSSPEPGRELHAEAEDVSAMMHSPALQAFGRLDLPPLPPPRDKLPTLPYDLRAYAQESCLPDADDELVFTAGPPLDQFTGRVPKVASKALAPGLRLEPREVLLLSLIDGLSSVSMVVDLAGGDRDESLVVLCDLYARGYVALE